MADFNTAFSIILEHEGTEFVDDPADHGGATKFGLTLSFINENVDPHFTVEQLEDMHVDEATSIYLHYWWDKYSLGSIPNQAIATKVFDTIVNLGITGGTKQIQKACNEANIPIDIDGKLGPQTLQALAKNPTSILNNIRTTLVTFYEHIVLRDPSQSRFLKGWLTRANF